MRDHGERIDELAERARRDRETFDPPADPPDEAAAMEYLREGAGEALAVYIDARSGELIRFSTEEFARLEAAFNEYLELYAACYGVDIDAEFTTREGAELLVDTHDIHATAQLLTHVPSRGRTRQR